MIGLCFPKETFLYVLNRANASNYTELDANICAGIGEFMFHIYEKAHPQLNELGYLVDRAIPTLILGKDLSIPHIVRDPGFSLEFQTAGGPFKFEIGFKTGL